MSSVILVEHDGETTLGPPALFDALEGLETLVVMPTEVSIVTGHRGGEPVRGLRITLGDDLPDLEVVFPERVAAEIGQGIAGGVVRAVPGDVPGL